MSAYFIGNIPSPCKVKSQLKAVRTIPDMINPKTMSNIELSLLLPTYNEADIIEHALVAIETALSPDLCLKTEIIIVDDGTDALPDHVNRLKPKLKFADVIVLRNDPPLGKGKSLTAGFDKARGQISGFLDVDLSTPPRYIMDAVTQLLEDKCDVYIGSRRIQGSKVNREQFFLKDILGNVLGVIARKIIFSGMRSYRDTQCGFKFYKTPVAKLLYFELMANDGLNDLEVLIRANLLGYRVEEIGVQWEDLRESKRSLRRILWGELTAISKILIHYKIFPSTQLLNLKEISKRLTF